SVRNLVTHAQGNAKFTAATVWFDNVNRIGVKLSTVEGVTLKVNGETVELTGTTYYTDGIFATDFGKSYTFELYEGETLIETLTYSVNSYTFSMIGKTEEDGVTPTKMAELAKALYRYGVSAVSYKNAN
ncbi:MAG: hypothetical protein IKB23_06570, partial [Clostridia bacterium]|nr:hypothetical protein [Clostridia bacterium]